MSVADTKRRFDILNEATTVIAQALDMSYTEALHETFQNLHANAVQQIDGEPDDQTKAKLEALYEQEDWTALSVDKWRELVQLLMLTANQNDQLPPNNQMTPPAIALLMGEMAKRLTALDPSTDSARHLVDLAFGTGNLWRMVARALARDRFVVTGEGVDNDELMLGIAEHSLAIERLAPTLYLGDSLQPVYVQPADLVVGDLPVGYYPLTRVAEAFDSNNADVTERGLSYAHPLFIEQGLHVLKAGGWESVLVPAQLFEMAGNDKLLQAIRTHAYFQGLLQLPSTLFRQDRLQKSILLLQKQGAHAKQAAHVLVGGIPDLKDGPGMRGFIQQFDEWVNDFKN